MPLPLPLAPLVTVIQLALLDAVQPHPAVVVTLALALPPAAAIAWLVGDTVKAHAPLWVTVTV